MTRRGRIADDERFLILQELGEYAKEKYQENLRRTGYKGMSKFMDAFQYEPDVKNFDNHYWIDTGNEELNRILRYLEYGTGLYGPNRKRIESKKTSPKTGNQLLLKFNYRGVPLYRMSVKGIKPGFMFTKAIESVRHNRNILQKMARNTLGI